MRRARFTAVCLTAFILICGSGTTAHAEGVVQTTQQIYSFAEMQQDIVELQELYPDRISYSSLGLTGQGRDVYALCLGNPYASKHVMIQASMHAREYMTSQLVMRIIEYVCDNYDTMMVGDKTYRELFDSVNFYIVPMVNPDGVSIAQYGTAGANLDDTKVFLESLKKRKLRLDQYKANGNGVDLNNNFSVGWGNVKNKKNEPFLYFYPGPCAQSEMETNALVALAGAREYAAFLNYHSQGNVIYFATSACSEETYRQSAYLADLIQIGNGYKKEDHHSGEMTGTFADYVQYTYDKPSVTVEIGTANPVPIGQFNGIYLGNRDSWGWLAYAVYYNEIG